MSLRTALLRLLPLLILSITNIAGADVLEDALERGSIRFGVAVFVPWTMKSDSGESGTWRRSPPAKITEY